MLTVPRLLLVGVAVFGLSLAYLFFTSKPAEQIDMPPPPAASDLPAPIPTVDVAPNDLPDDALPADASDLTPEQLATFETFDDTPLPESDDELLVIERGDASRYVTEQDRAESLARQQRAWSRSLGAASFFGDERIEGIGVLGDYARTGNPQAIGELRRILATDDAALRADALDAVAELLPFAKVPPATLDRALTGDEVDDLLEALRNSR